MGEIPFLPPIPTLHIPAQGNGGQRAHGNGGMSAASSPAYQNILPQQVEPREILVGQFELDFFIRLDIITSSSMAFLDTFHSIFSISAILCHFMSSPKYRQRRTLGRNVFHHFISSSIYARILCIVPLVYVVYKRCSLPQCISQRRGINSFTRKMEVRFT